MSQTLYVGFRGNGFWVYDVVSSVFLKFLIDAATRFAERDRSGWLAEATQHWRVNALTSDFGLYLDDDWSDPKVDTVIDLCGNAIEAVRERGDIPSAEAQSWAILDEQRICVRGHDPVPCEPVARFGSAVTALLENTLPEPPDRHRWFFTLANDVDTIAIHGDT